MKSKKAMSCALTLCVSFSLFNYGNVAKAQPNMILTNINSQDIKSLPAGLVAYNVGNPTPTGGDSSFDSMKKVFTITGTGDDIAKDAGRADSFHYVYYKVPQGDYVVEARYIGGDYSLTPQSRAGLLIRDGLEDVESYFGLVMDYRNNQMRYSYRDKSLSKQGSAALGSYNRESTNVYMRLEKTGTSLVSKISTDPAFPAELTTSKTQAVNMNGEELYVGFAVANGTSNSGDAVVQFDKFKISQGDNTIYDSTIGAPMKVENVEGEIGNKTVQLVWDDIEDATSYAIKKQVIGTNTVETINVSKEDVSTIDGKVYYAVSNLENGVDYSFAVAGVNSYGEGEASDNIVATPLETLPPVKVIGEKSKPGNAYVDVTWNESKDADSYTVYMGTSIDNLEKVTSATEIKETKARIVGLQNGTKYYFAVVANNANGESVKNKVLESTPLQPLSAPVTVVGSADNAKVNIAWSKVSNATAYIIKRADSENGEYVDIAEVSGTEVKYIDRSVVNGKTYYYKMSTLRGEVEGDTSSVITATPYLDSKNTITNLSVKDTVYGGCWGIQNGFNVGSQIFGDRVFKATVIPEEFIGADYIRTAMDSKLFSTPAAPKDVLATFTANADSEVYIAFDDRVTLVPDWLKTWTKTEQVIKDNGGTQVVYDLYKKEFKKGEQVVLGPNTEAGYSSCANYFVLAKKKLVDISTGDSSVKEQNFKVSGKVLEGTTVSIKNNGALTGEKVTFDKDSDLDLDVVLQEGINNIEVIGETSTGMTYVQNIKVIYDKNAPAITDTTKQPENVLTVPRFTVKGTVDEDVLVNIKVNGNEVFKDLHVKAGESYLQELALIEGDNIVEIIAKDEAGNETVLTYTVKYVFVAGEITFTDLLGNAVNKLEASKFVVAKTAIKNDLEISKNAVLMVGLYNAKGELVEMSSSNIGIVSSDLRVLSAGFKMPQNVEGLTVRAFVWDGINSIRPISEVKVLK